MFYTYKICWYDETIGGDGHTDGLVFAANYAEAAGYLMQVYGEGSIIKLSLCGLGEGCNDNVIEKDQVLTAFYS